LQCEQLEERSVPSNVRIVTYNMAADINGVTTPKPGFYQVLEGIGEEVVQGHVQPLDILALQETTSNSVTVAPVVTALNSYYTGLAVYAQSPYQGTQSGTASGGNGPNALVYNTSTLRLLASVGVGTPRGSSNGEYRQVVRYEFQPIGSSGSSNIFYIYDSHAKSGGTSSDLTSRNLEAQIIRNDEATLPADARVIYLGDENTGASTEASVQTFYAANSPGGVHQGAGFDPLNRPGNWQLNSAFQDILTESDTNLRYRDDLQMPTQNIINDTPGGLGYIAGSYHTFGVNGSTPIHGSVNNGSNTALNNDLVPDGGTFIPASALYGYLTTGSDHLPVVADYTFGGGGGGTPTIGSFTANPPSVPLNGATTLVAGNVTEPGGTIANVTFYLETNGIPGLQPDDATLGTGTQNGNDWSFYFDTTGGGPGTYTVYAVATDTNGNNSAVASTTVTVTGSGYTGVVLGWDVNGQSSFGTQGLAATQVAPGVSNTLGLTRGSGVSASGSGVANGWGGNNWAATSAAGISGNKFVTFGLTVSAGSTASLSSIDLFYRHSATGPNSGLWQYEVNGGAWTTIGDFPNEFPSTSTSGALMNELDLSGVSGLQNLSGGTVVVFRLVPYASSGSGGTWYVYDQSGNDLIVNGTIAGGFGPQGGSKGGAGGRSTQPVSGADLSSLLLVQGRRVAGGFPNLLPGVAPPGASPAPPSPLLRVEQIESGWNDVAWWHTTRDEALSRRGDDLVWALWGEGAVTDTLGG
jgi:hypothetical protein